MLYSKLNNSALIFRHLIKMIQTSSVCLWVFWHYKSGRGVCQSKTKGMHYKLSWWRHQMETFSTLLAICAWNSPVPSEFPTQRPVTWSFDVSFDLRRDKCLSKQSWGWWFERLARPLWSQCNVVSKLNYIWSVYHFLPQGMLVLKYVCILTEDDIVSWHRQCILCV